MKIKTLVGICVSLVLLIGLTGCSLEKEEDEGKIRDLEFTVVEDEDLPEIVANRIEEEKKESFKFSYSNGEYIYIVIGYGEQPTGGYSIQVEKLYETDQYIIVSTTLLGPSKEETVVTAVTYPYIVVKTEDLQKSVCFK